MTHQRAHHQGCVSVRLEPCSFRLLLNRSYSPLGSQQLRCARGAAAVSSARGGIAGASRACDDFRFVILDLRQV